MSELQRALGLELAVIQAPMAGVQDHALAVAVLNAGGLASLPCAMLFADRPARGIVNRLIRDLNAADPAPAFPLATSAIAPLRKVAEARGSGDFSPLWSEQNAGGCRAVGAAELTRGLVDA